MSQTVYNSTPAVGFAGMEIDSEPSLKRAAILEESSAIPFGVFVKRGTADTQALLPASANDIPKLLGVALSTYWQNNRSLASALGIAAADTFDVIEEGGVWVLCEQDVLVADLGKCAYVRVTTDGGSNTQLGKVRKDVDTGRAVRVAGALFDSVATAGSPVKLRLRAPLGGVDAISPMRFDHAQVTGDTTLRLFKNDADRHMRIKSISYINPTGLAQDATNVFAIKVQDAAASKVYGTWDTTTGQNGTIAADTWVSLTLGTNLIVAPGEAVNLLLDEGGTATLPAGSVVVHAEMI